MARHVHVYLHRATQDAESDADGKWVTINGAHVFIGKGGKIEKGPKALIGKAHAEASKPPAVSGSSTKAERTKAAHAEYEKASKADGNFHHAAELYESAGHTEKAASAHALAKRYGHTPEAVALRRQADKDNASTARAQAKRAASTKARDLLLKKAELHERMAESEAPRGDDKTAKELRALTDELAREESRAQMHGGDLDKKRAQLMKENPGMKPDEANELMAGGKNEPDEKAVGRLNQLAASVRSGENRIKSLEGRKDHTSQVAHKEAVKQLNELKDRLTTMKRHYGLDEAST